MPELLSRLDYYDIGRRHVLTHATRINPTTVDTDGSDINIILGASSYMANAVARQNIERINSLMLDATEDEDLDRLAWDRYQEVRKGATAAVVPIELERPTAALGAGNLPIGTKLLSLDGIEYILTTAAIFGASTLRTTANGRAAQSGKEYQVGANQIRRFDKPNLIFDQTIAVNNSEPASGGEPAESNDVFRERVRGFFTAARRGIAAAIETGALTVPGVESAQVFEQLDEDGNPSGYVELFIADSSGVANQTLGVRVTEALEEFRAAGIPVAINTSRPVIVDLAFRLTFRAGVDTSTLRDQVRAAVVTFVNSLGVNETLLVADLQAVLSRFKSQGLIVNQNTIVEPVGDIVPTQGTTIRTRDENVQIL